MPYPALFEAINPCTNEIEFQEKLKELFQSTNSFEENYGIAIIAQMSLQEAKQFLQS